MEFKSGCLVYEEGEGLCLFHVYNGWPELAAKVNSLVEAVVCPDGLSGLNTRYKINLISDKTSLSFN